MVPIDADKTISYKRVTVAAAFGTTVEYYDFFIYGTAAALVLGKLFFPSFSTLAGTLAVFAIFAAGFLARPLGAIVFGYFGDRVGRKSVLIVTLLTMGIATAGIGALPTFATAGVWAPILLVTLRIIQGFAVAGEWGNATVLISEYAPPGRRGLLGALVQNGSPAGLLLSSGVFALVSQLPERQFLAWGWRVPFLISLVMVAIGLYIRLSVLESPEFVRAVEEKGTLRAPVIEAIRSAPKNFFIAIGARFAPDIIFYVSATFLITYAQSHHHGVSPGTVLAGVAVAAAVEICTVPFFGWLSDRVGRRPVYLAGAAFCAVIAFPIFALVGTGVPALAWLGLILAFAIGHASMWSIGAALYSELFDTRYRCSGASLGFNLSIVVGGGPAPFIATALVSWASGAYWPVSVYIICAAAISMFSLWAAKETNGSSLADDLRSTRMPVLEATDAGTVR